MTACKGRQRKSDHIDGDVVVEDDKLPAVSGVRQFNEFQLGPWSGARLGTGMRFRIRFLER